MARNTIKPRLFERNPFPKVFDRSGVLGIPAGQQITLEYENKPNEISEIEYIDLLMPPTMRVTVRVTINGQDRTVHETVDVSDVGGRIQFKDTGTDKTLTIQKGEKVFVDVFNPLGVVIPAKVILQKDQLMFYMEDEIAKTEQSIESRQPGR